MEKIAQSETSERQGSLYHPSYTNNNVGDVILLSKDGIYFHVHSAILRLSSTVFRDMFEIPKSHYDEVGDPVPLDEKSEIIATFLDIIYPNIILREKAVENAIYLHTEEVINVADKYDIPGVIAVVKRVLYDPSRKIPTNEDHWSAIRRYDLACKYSWRDEAKLAAGWTLHESLTTPQSLSEVERISTRSVLQLQKLHRIRIEKFLESLDDLGQRHRNHADSCYNSTMYCVVVSSDAWNHFVYTILNELDDCPLGLSLSKPEKWDVEGYSQIFTITYDKGRCKQPYFYKNSFIVEVQKLLENLPIFV